ncbi:ATP-binding cassette domain-containing protein [Tumebacillus permanentifrigoris]|uniref:ATP-binding cassette domain-containing protein n=1 Tax=Tumebacillus permanentifrigoris TaxID=378543 RepID=UPI000D6D810C|nr:ATP-binding cassette domain-containing protein [Tumebacillus permanentifrigoris]
MLDGASIIVQDRERVVLIGVIGAGKSTLLKIIVDDMTYDSGTSRGRGHLPDLLPTLPQKPFYQGTR